MRTCNDGIMIDPVAPGQNRTNSEMLNAVVPKVGPAGEAVPGDGQREREARLLQGVAERALDLVEHTEDVDQHTRLLASRAEEVHRRSEVIADNTRDMADNLDLAHAIDRLSEGLADNAEAIQAKHTGEGVARGVTKLQKDLKRHAEALVTESLLVTKRSRKVAKRSTELAGLAEQVDANAKRLALKTQELLTGTQAMADLCDAEQPSAAAGDESELSSERLRLEDELKRQNQALIELDQRKTELLHSVSHELRAPLTTIQGYAEFLEDNLGGELTPEQAAFVREIKRSVDRLKQHVDDLLDFSLLEAGTFAPHLQMADLNTVIRNVVTGEAPAARDANCELDLELAPHLPPVLMDPRRIEQVVFNLIGNAIKFSARGGVIRIRTRLNGDLVLCEVEDSGIGIAKSEIPLLFERFMQLDGGRRLGVGAGLGLNISKKLIEAHHGQLGIRSTLGEGSTFWFTLSLAAGP